MTDLMQRVHPFQAALFDCDGVLVDSENITNRVLQQMLNESGWHITEAECMRCFVGKMVISQKALIEANTGKPLTDTWMAEFYQRRNRALAEEVCAIDGAVAMVQSIYAAFSGRIACASGADRAKLTMQMEKVGLWPYFESRVFSGHDVAANKPAPDVYLAAALGLGVLATNCVVIEDSVTGVRAGAAAGATVLAFCPHGHHTSAHALKVAGAQVVFADLATLTSALCQHQQVH
ncbi:HAD family phosphatase [Snodgrassella sp. CFCC 13594]|uniref:HAD family hydrolase n=1 Tax=Snodgrassella sp. CFCC 13594 TaxID=1775559 RepID=UPI000AB6FEF6|nr:HAD family phosphatase [Snodgrassella sp. CFCC 13594]